MVTICHEPVTSGLTSGTGELLTVLAARAACALEHSIPCLLLANDQNLGHLELQAAQAAQELLPQACLKLLA